MIKLRIDVDYPYPSRIKSFVFVALGIKHIRAKDYLKNAHIIAKMVNESRKEIKAFWFFTPFTIPDKKLLNLLNSERHEVALHVAINPDKERKVLERETSRFVQFYTIHGTSSLSAQLLWKRKLGQKQVNIPGDFPLKSFHDFLTTSLDTRIYEAGFDTVKSEALNWVKNKTVISIHPDWLFVKGERNRRGPYYDALKIILDVDQEFETIRLRKKLFVQIAQDNQEYEKNVSTTKVFLEKLVERGADIYTFLDRPWGCPISDPPRTWIRVNDNVGLLKLTSMDAWWNTIGKKTRNMIRRAEKKGIEVRVVQPDEELAEGIWKIYNETPIRQGRGFPHYGESLKSVTDNMFLAKNSTFLGAYLENELFGFIQLIYGDQIAIISQILSSQKHWDKALNNALLAKAVEVCVSSDKRWLLYGRFGNHPSLDKFKESNGFTKYPIARYYVPLTRKGKFAILVGLHKPLKDTLPELLKGPLIPVFNWISRTKAQMKNRRKR
jgi:hypothetical protein